MRRAFASLLVALLCASSEPAIGAKRVALVIGNDAYEELPVLRKAGADATDFAALLREKGFDQVILRHNLPNMEINLALGEFLDRISPGDTAVFFYSGHGWSNGNQNFLVGTDSPATAKEITLSRISVPIQNGANGIIDEMAARGAALKVVILDACRDNPFLSPIPGRSVGIGRGLTRIEPPRGTFVVFSAGAGQVALDRLSDSDSARNSVFTRTFLPLLRADMPLLDAVKATQEQVFELVRRIGHEQEPAYYDQVRGDACLSPRCRSATGGVQPSGAAGLTADREMKVWMAIQDSRNPADFLTFLSSYPLSSLAPYARNRLDSLEAAMWESIARSERRSDLQRYLSSFPDGQHASEVTARLAALEAGEQEEGEALSQTGDGASSGTVLAALPPDAGGDAGSTEPNEPDAVAPPTLDQHTLVRTLQSELKRVGCYSGSVDGIWGRISRRSLTEFARIASLDIPAANPSSAPSSFGPILEELRGYTDRACPLVCGPGLVARGGACVPRNTQAPASGQHPRENEAASQSESGSCFVFNGQEYCE